MWKIVDKITGISAFDLDNTLVSVNSSFDFGRYLCKRRFLHLTSFLYIIGYSLFHKAGVLSIEKVHYGAFERFFKGRSEPEVKVLAHQFLDLILDKILYQPAISALRTAQAEGHLTLLLSSGPDFLVGEVAKRLGIPYWQSTQYAVDKDRHFCHISRLMLGADKAQILADLRHQFAVSKENTFAYSDSHLDLPFLLEAGSSIAVNPNRELRRQCQQNGWQII